MTYFKINPILIRIDRWSCRRLKPSARRTEDTRAFGRNSFVTLAPNYDVPSAWMIKNSIVRIRLVPHISNLNFINTNYLNDYCLPNHLIAFKSHFSDYLNVLTYVTSLISHLSGSSSLLIIRYGFANFRRHIAGCTNHR